MSSSDNPVLVDQGSSTEVEPSTILGIRRGIFAIFSLWHFFIQITHGIKTVAKVQWQWVWIVHYLGYLKRNLPGPGPRHSSLPIYYLVVSAHLGLDSRYSTPWGPVTQMKNDVVVQKFGMNCTLFTRKFQNVFHVLLHEVCTLLMCKQWYVRLLLHCHKQFSHR